MLFSGDGAAVPSPCVSAAPSDALQRGSRRQCLQRGSSTARSSDTSEVWPEAGRAALSALPAGSQVGGTPLPCPCGNHCSGRHCWEWVCCLLLSRRESGFVCFQKILPWHLYRRQKWSVASWGWFLVEIHRLPKPGEMSWLWSVVLCLLKPIR